MATQLALSSKLKLTQLKALAFKCGVAVSGTKNVLAQRLVDEITSSNTAQHAKKARNGPPKGPMRILSIDMGIRNLAYCLLEVGGRNGNGDGKKGENKLPIIQAWQRLAVSSAPTADLTADSSTSPKTNSKSKSKPSEKEPFDPMTLSATAYTLLRTRLLALKPTHILIERQRFRSMGGKHILEWTIRVNMFEAILHAILHTLRAEGVWEGEVKAIVPSKVGPFWIGDEEIEDGDAEKEGGENKAKIRTSQSAKVRNKGLKIDLVTGWLKEGKMVRLGNDEVEKMALAYKEKWDRVPGRQRKVKILEGGEVVIEMEKMEKIPKLDDLADSLLQGMAWIQWEENKRIALHHGVEALLEPME